MKARGFCFTINNYTEEQWENLKTLKSCQYIVMGQEVGSSGTAHIQGYVYFTNPVSWDSIRKLIPGHVEIAKGNSKQNRDYCTKEAETIHEWGQIPIQGKRTDMDSILEMITDGASLRELYLTFPSQCVRYGKGVQRLMEIVNNSDEDRNIDVRYYWGDAGSGKTRRAMREAREGGSWFKMDSNKWFDGYAGEKTLIIDDFSWMDWNRAYLLKILDRYPMRVEQKGSSIQAKWTTVIITSNEAPIEDEAFRRRLKKIVHIHNLPGVKTGTEVAGNNKAATIIIE